MAITTLDGYIAAASQQVSYLKTASRTGVAGIPFSVFDLAGNPGAGTLAIGNTANGIVPTDALAGYPIIGSLNANGYIGVISFGSTVACRMILMDCLFSAGAYAFNANVALASQPSFAGRVPNGTDFNNTELWLEAVTAFTGNQSIAVTYTNQSGTAARTTGTIATGVAPIVGRMFQMPLAAGDTGLQKVESVVSSVSTVGTFNVHVMSRKWMGRVRIANDGDVHDFLKTGMPPAFADSALRVIIMPDGTATGTPEFMAEIVDG